MTHAVHVEQFSVEALRLLRLKRMALNVVWASAVCVLIKGAVHAGMYYEEAGQLDGQVALAVVFYLVFAALYIGAARLLQHDQIRARNLASILTKFCLLVNFWLWPTQEVPKDGLSVLVTAVTLIVTLSSLIVTSRAVKAAAQADAEERGKRPSPKLP